jgi:acetyl-CoA C-acetyltransferase
MQAQNDRSFDWEICPVKVPTRKGDVIVDRDEGVLRAQVDKIPTLRPAFAKDGTVTAGNASSISDGAASLVLMRQSTAQSLQLAPLARVVCHVNHAQAPEWFTTAPVEAVKKLLAKAGWRVADVDLWEINEAFAVVPLAAIELLGLDDERVNVNGGACVLGHPIGASGARLIVTLIGALKSRGLKRGVATLCIGGGEATAIAIELV